MDLGFLVFFYLIMFEKKSPASSVVAENAGKVILLWNLRACFGLANFNMGLSMNNV